MSWNSLEVNFGILEFWKMVSTKLVKYFWKPNRCKSVSSVILCSCEYSDSVLATFYLRMILRGETGFCLLVLAKYFRKAWAQMLNSCFQWVTDILIFWIQAQKYIFSVLISLCGYNHRINFCCTAAVFYLTGGDNVFRKTLRNM